MKNKLKNNEEMKVLGEKTYTVELVTPDYAAELLKGNTHNRAVSKVLVGKYAEVMKRHEWRQNDTEPISFTDRGVLLDGQHRLLAVIKSGESVPMCINRNGRETDFEVINTGKKRSQGDILGLYGVPNRTQTASIIGAYLDIRDFGLWGRPYLNTPASNPQKEYARNTHHSAKECLEEYRKDPDKWNDIVIFTDRCCRCKKGSAGVAIVPNKIVGKIYAYLYFVKGYSTAMIETYLEGVTNGTGNEDVMEWLYSIFERNRNRRSFKMSAIRMQTYIAKGWNIYREGKPFNFNYGIAVRDRERVEFC